jgi:hypothetical protein
LPLHITEFWAGTRELKEEGRLNDEEIDALQAQYVTDYLTCALGHPAIEAFFCWDTHILHHGDFSSHSLVPAYEKIRETIAKEWMTRWTGVTSADGLVRFHGFFGDYSLRYDVAVGTRRGERFAVDRHAGMPLTVVIS